MDELVLLFPILIPFITGILCIFSFKNVELQRIMVLIGMALLLVTGVYLVHTVNTEGIQSIQVGGWEAPGGISIVLDMFSAIMVAVTGLMGFAIAIYSLGSMDLPRQRFGFYPLYSIMLMGVCGAFTTGDLFNLYVWFEVLLISSFVLLALGGERRQLAGAIQYVAINLVSSAIFLAAVGMTYSVAGTLNMADLAQEMQYVEQPGMVNALAMMFLIAFGIKAAIFPLFFWLPVSYDTPPITVTAIFAALLTKVGVYSLVRVFTLIFVQDTEFTHTILMIIAAFTMVSGVYGAASEYEFRRVLSFHIISQIGYMIMGLALYTPLALSAMIYFLLHNIVAKANLFLISGVTQRLQGTYKLKKMGGLYKAYPILGVLFLIPALSLAGIPPLSGFWGKFALVRAGLESEDYIIIGVSLYVSVWTLYSMIKIWTEAFLKDRPEVEPSENAAIDPPATESIWESTPMLYMILPIIALAVVTVLLGVIANPIFELTNTAGEQLISRTEYIETVLGNR